MKVISNSTVGSIKHFYIHMDESADMYRDIIINNACHHSLIMFVSIFEVLNVFIKV